MQTPKAARHRLAAELPWHFLWAADAGDRLVAERSWPRGFAAYAEAMGWGLPEKVSPPTFDPAWRPQPFVWTRAWLEAAAGGEAGAGRQALLPQAHWAGREYCRSLQLGLFQDPSAGAGAQATEAWGRREATGLGGYAGLAKLMESLPPDRSWVFKGEWGFGGLAQVRFSTPVKEEDARRLRRLWKAHGGGVVERLDAVAEEFGVVADVRPCGDHPGYRVEWSGLHRLLAGPRGEFLGAAWASVGAGSPDVGSELQSAAQRIGEALGQEGFRGLFAFDAYTFRDPNTGDLRLRPLVDLNPRPTLALPLHGLARRLLIRHSGPFHLRWCFIPRRRLAGWRLPDACDAWFDWAGNSAYRPEQGRGWIPGSPWDESMERFSLATVGRDADECEALENAFLEQALA